MSKQNVSGLGLKSDIASLMKEIEVAKKMRIVNTTQAGAIAKELDAKDGKKDGQISASVWNAYAAEHGGKSVKNSISLIDATNSITTYMVREAANAKKKLIEILQQVQDNVEQGNITREEAEKLYKETGILEYIAVDNVSEAVNSAEESQDNPPTFGL